MVRHLGGPGFNLQCHHQLLINGVSLGLPLHSPSLTLLTFGMGVTIPVLRDSEDCRDTVDEMLSIEPGVQ